MSGILYARAFSHFGRFSRRRETPADPWDGSGGNCIGWQWVRRKIETATQELERQQNQPIFSRFNTTEGCVEIVRGLRVLVTLKGACCECELYRITCTQRDCLSDEFHEICEVFEAEFGKKFRSNPK